MIGCETDLVILTISYGEFQGHNLTAWIPKRCTLFPAERERERGGDQIQRIIFVKLRNIDYHVVNLNLIFSSQNM